MIVSIVGKYVDLKKQGRNYFGLCPFHEETSPSFSVNPRKKIFYCFGCGVGGTAEDFLEKIGANLTVAAVIGGFVEPSLNDANGAKQ